MVRKHLYLHSSNLSYASLLCKDNKFETPVQYPPFDYQNSMRTEYGRIKTDSAYYHIILGHLDYDKKDCPYCGCHCVRKEIHPNVCLDPTGKSKLWMECPKCLSRGPLLNACPDIFIETQCAEHVWHMVEGIFNRRVPWDQKLVNPYEMEVEDA